MPDKFFLSASGTFSSGADLITLVRDQRVLWSGHCAVAEYAFDQPASLPRWTLAEETEVVITEQQIVYANFAAQSAGGLSWRWPQHLRVQPGNRDTGRSATVTQIQLVCAGPGGTFPALVLAAGDLAAVSDADRLANVLRQAIARFRVEHATELGLASPQARMLSRQVIGPEFNNYQDGAGQTVTLLGSAPVDTMMQLPSQRAFLSPLDLTTPRDLTTPLNLTSRAEPARTEPVWPEPARTEPGWTEQPPRTEQPWAERAWATRTQAEPAWIESAPEPAWVKSAAEAGWGESAQAEPAWVEAAWAESTPADVAVSMDGPTTNLSDYARLPQLPQAGPQSDPATTEQARAERAEKIRRTAARFAGNSARARNSIPQRAEDEAGWS